jgi:hypothetical protein
MAKSISVTKNQSLCDLGLEQHDLTHHREWNALKQPSIDRRQNVEDITDTKARIYRKQTVLLVIGPTTSMANLEDVLRSFEQPDVRISVVYTSKPPLLDGTRTEGEVDFEFASELETGNVKLLEAKKIAREFGFYVETSFVWSNSVKEIVKRSRKENEYDMVIDIRDIPD